MQELALWMLKKVCFLHRHCYLSLLKIIMQCGYSICHKICAYSFWLYTVAWVHPLRSQLCNTEKWMASAALSFEYMLCIFLLFLMCHYFSMQKCILKINFQLTFSTFPCSLVDISWNSEKSYNNYYFILIYLYWSVQKCTLNAVCTATYSNVSSFLIGLGCSIMCVCVLYVFWWHFHSWKVMNRNKNWLSSIKINVIWFTVQKSQAIAHIYILLGK